MKNFEKYERSYFMPPVPCYDWVKKDHIEKPPVWCSVDLRDGNQALIEPMSLEEKIEFFQMLLDVGFKQIDPAVRQGCGWTGVPLYPLPVMAAPGAARFLQTAVSRSYRQDDSKTNERK